jgi:hypothetical protein
MTQYGKDTNYTYLFWLLVEDLQNLYSSALDLLHNMNCYVSVGIVCNTYIVEIWQGQDYVIIA